jgi:hypothetical protein
MSLLWRFGASHSSRLVMMFRAIPLRLSRELQRLPLRWRRCHGNRCAVETF